MALRYPVNEDLKPSAREAFADAHLFFLAKYFRNKVMVNDFAIPNDVTLALVPAIVGPPAQAAHAHRLSARGIAGSDTYSITLAARTANPYRGVLSAEFNAGTSDGQGVQINDSVIGVLMNGIGQNFTYAESLSIEWCAEFAILDAPGGGVGFIGVNDFVRDALMNIPPFIINPDGCAGVGFWIDVDGNLHAIYGNHEINMEDLIVGTVEQNKPVQVAFRYHYFGAGPSADFGNIGAPRFPSNIEWFVNGHQVFRTSNNFVNNWITSQNQTPCIALGRNASSFRMVVPYWSMAYNTTDVVLPG